MREYLTDNRGSCVNCKCTIEQRVREDMFHNKALLYTTIILQLIRASFLKGFNITFLCQTELISHSTCEHEKNKY